MIGKNKAKTRVLLVSGTVALVLGAVSVSVLLPSRPFTAAFVGLSDAEAEAFAPLFPAGARIVRMALPEGEGDGLGRIKADCVVAPSGLAMLVQAGRFEPPPARSVSAVPPSLARALRTRDGPVAAMPLQIDPFLMAWDKEAFVARGLTEPATLRDVEAALAAYRDPVGPALLFAGGDDETLLGILSLLCVSELGKPGYDRAVEAIRGSASFDLAMDAPLGSGASGFGASLRSLAGRIVAWKSAGYLHPEWQNLQPKDLRSYLQKGYGFIILAPLSFRRSVDYQSVYRFGSAPYPAAVRGDTLVAPMSAAWFHPRSSVAAQAEAVQARMLDPDTAYAMAKATGRATALSAARAPDVQAADALSWAAGSQNVVGGLYRDAFADAALARAFAARLRDWIRTAK